MPPKKAVPSTRKTVPAKAAATASNTKGGKNVTKAAPGGEFNQLLA